MKQRSYVERAEQAERERIEREHAEAEARRQADINHRATVDREAYKAMLGIAIVCTHDQVARQIFIAIQEGRIPHISIGY